VLVNGVVTSETANPEGPSSSDDTAYRRGLLAPQTPFSTNGGCAIAYPFYIAQLVLDALLRVSLLVILQLFCCALAAPKL
jgi:hypothetical protein